MGTGSFPGVEAAGAWAWPPTPISSRGPRKSRAIPLLTLRALVAYKKNENLPTYLQILVSYWSINLEKYIIIIIIIIIINCN